MDRCPAILALGFALLCLQSLSCLAAATGPGAAANAEAGTEDSGSGSESLIPCSYRGEILLHGESMRIDECISCHCVNSSVICNLQGCPVIACGDGQEPVAELGECCESCPDPSTQVDVATSQNYDCRYNDVPLSVGEVHIVDACTTCVCQAALDVKCEIRSCPPVKCLEPINLDGGCCDVCPYDLPIWKIQPSEPPAITAGKLNNVPFNLVMHINVRSGATVAGKNLIKVSAWAADGRGNRVGYIDQVLTAEQASRNIITISKSGHLSGYEYRIDGIEFSLDASDATCSQMEYLCVEVAKGDNPKVTLPFTLEGVASERNDTEVPSNLVGCIHFPECEDVGTRTRVSFSVAKKSGQIALEPVAILGWTTVFNNVGGAFDSETGVFTSFVTGSYFFVYQITETDNAQSGPQVRLMQNDETDLTGISNSNSIIIDLEAGDTVWLQLQGELVGTTDIYTTFSGFLI